MQPYVIKDGDFLLQLAFQMGFDADTVWNDPSNADLQGLRSDPNILLPGDVLQVPDPPDPNTQAPPATLTPGSTNNFVAADPPTVSLTHTFTGDDTTSYASMAYTVQELPQLTGLQTDENGTVTFQAPVTLQTTTIVFTESGDTWTLALGGMDPINTISGMFKRLQNLGYFDDDVQYDADNPLNNIGVIRPALLALKPPPDAPPAMADTLPPDSSPPSAPPSVPGSTPPPSQPAPASGPPSSGAAAGDGSAPDAGSGWCCWDHEPDGSPDPSGLAGDGTLDDETTALLKAAYGC
jgi:hypothetical protein